MDKPSHIAQWKHNRDFLARTSLQFHDWIVTITFYTALHAVDVLLIHDNVSGIHSHDTRNTTLARTNRCKQINQHYKPLYGLARTVRYLADPRKWVPPEEVEFRVIKGYLYPIEESVQKLIGQDLGLAPIKIVGSVVAPKS